MTDDLFNLRVKVSMPRSCRCCGWTLPDEVQGYQGDCPGCLARIEMLANGYVGYRVTALGLLEASPTRH